MTPNPNDDRNKQNPLTKKIQTSINTEFLKSISPISEMLIQQDMKIADKIHIELERPKPSERELRHTEEIIARLKTGKIFFPAGRHFE